MYHFTRHVNDLNKALSIATQCSLEQNADQWFWWQQVGECHLAQGHASEARLAFEESLKLQENIQSRLQLCRMDGNSSGFYPNSLDFVSLDSKSLQAVRRFF